jgi:single-stranded-DNA-specific exonuclease
MTRSILNRKWNLLPQDSSLNIIHNILNNRGISESEKINTYLNPSYKKGFHNPFLMKDMDKAVARLKKAIETQERVIVFGDYDVDGISGTAVLVNALKLCGVNVSYRLPHRVNDGYGLNIKFIDEFKDKDIGILITVDCGISCKEQIAEAARHNIDVIITDHHTIPEQIPDQAYAILHPKQPGCEYPFKGLTGSGVAYKLATALITEKFTGDARDNIIYSLLDLASLGTVADIGPLLDENRIIVKYGLEAMQNTRWPGLSLLLNTAGVDPDQKLDVSVIGFKIGPRINAAGRIDSPYYALQMLLHEGDEEKGRGLAAHLEKLNQDRQQLVFKALEEAEVAYSSHAADRKIFIAWSPDWHVGILGLIASKMVEKYNLPAIALQEFDQHLVASFRSNESLNAVDLLNFAKEHLSHFGGHAQAAGFSLPKDKLPAFIEAANQFAQEKLHNFDFERELPLEAELTKDDINDNLMRLLSQMEPFGVGNEKPLFLIKNVRLADLKRVGKESNHLHFWTDTGAGKFSSISFKNGDILTKLQQHQSLDLAFYLEKNVWNGRESIQFQVIDFRPSTHL